MNTLLADPPAVADPEQPLRAPTLRRRSRGSARCRRQPPRRPDLREMRRADGPGQDWCLQCGAGAPGSLDAGGPSWRSAAVILTATAVLVLGAAAAAYAALDKEGAPKAHRDDRRGRPTTTPTVHAHAHDAGHTDADDTGSGGPHAESLRDHRNQPADPHRRRQPAENPAHGAHSEIHRARPRRPRKPTKRAPRHHLVERSNHSGGGDDQNRARRDHARPDAASTYNPYGYPASEFGDPSLAIDGDTSTAWTAQVNPAVAPKMAEGLADRPEERPAALGGRADHLHPRDERAGVWRQRPTPPTSITDPAWIQLSPYLVEKKHNDADQAAGLGKGVPLHHAVDQQGPRARRSAPLQAPGHVA